MLAPVAGQERSESIVQTLTRIFMTAVVGVLGGMWPPPAAAQADEPTGVRQQEELEPRVIGQRGQTLIGFSGSMSRFFSSADLMAGAYTMQVDAHWFLSRRVALRFGVVGSGTFAGDDDSEDEAAEDAGNGPLETGVEALGGALFYFTPGSMWSFYTGGEYRRSVTERTGGDVGSVNGLVGLQGALSSRAAFFLEGGYGMRLRRGDENEILTRIVGLVGVRFRF
jgi:hypothetical protein